MARPPDPLRKPALLEQIVEYLLDRPLATLSLRTLASGLAVSTYTLVYHFGNRAELLREIVQAISSRQSAILAAVTAETGDMETHLRNLRESWDWILLPRNRQLQRLEFEASMLEAQDRGPASITPQVFARWHRAGYEALRSMGLADADADLEARIITNTMYGLQYDLILNGDDGKATAAFIRAMQNYRDRILRLQRSAARSGSETCAVES
ncbi:MAG: TetR/AcrR family transcriptional regulator [Lacisediminihabitans sp.]